MCHKNSQFEYLIETVKTLRGDEGCPWDRRQTTDSMSKYLKAEMEELLVAIEKKDTENIKEELGDLLYILVMIAEINTQAGNFTTDQVLDAINNKLIRRHPHVFAGVKIDDEEELRAQWQRIKEIEKTEKNNI